MFFQFVIKNGYLAVTAHFHFHMIWLPERGYSQGHWHLSKLLVGLGAAVGPRDYIGERDDSSISVKTTSSRKIRWTVGV